MQWATTPVFPHRGGTCARHTSASGDAISISLNVCIYRTWLWFPLFFLNSAITCKKQNQLPFIFIVHTYLEKNWILYLQPHRIIQWTQPHQAPASKNINIKVLALIMNTHVQQFVQYSFLHIGFQNSEVTPCLRKSEKIKTPGADRHLSPSSRTPLLRLLILNIFHHKVRLDLWWPIWQHWERERAWRY